MYKAILTYYKTVFMLLVISRILTVLYFILRHWYQNLITLTSVEFGNGVLWPILNK